MPLINSIPESYEDGFKSLASLSDSDFEKLFAELENIQPVGTIRGLISKIELADALPKGDIYAIILSVGSLIPYYDSEEKIDEIISDVSEIATLEELVEEQNKEKFVKRLSALARSKAIFYAAKASNLSSGYGNAFINCRIISDIRPVFDVSIEKEATAAIIIHNLNIHYQSNEEPYHKDITLVLNASDLAELKEAIERAEKKESGLQNILDRASVSQLNK